MTEISAGAKIVARDAVGQALRKRALGPVTQGHDFMVVWVCREEEWANAHAEGRDPEGVPWPAEDVTLVDGA